MSQSAQLEGRGVGPTPVQFKSGDTVSAEIDLEGFYLAGFWLGPNFTGATITFQAAERAQGTFQPVFDQSGNPVSFAVAAGHTIVINPAGVPGGTGGNLGFLRHIKLVVASQGQANTIFVLRKQGAGY